MKLFLREHIPLIVMIIMQLIATLMVYWLDGYHHILTALYSVFLGICFLIGYLIYRYYSHRRYYNKLSHPSQALGESLQKTDHTPISIAFRRILEVQYNQYQSELKTWEHKQKEHLIFMNQWVHQMKTPVSVVALITQEEHGEAFESIAEEIDRMKCGLEMVLHMARLETFEQDFHVERVSLKTLAQEVIDENKRFFIRNYVYPKVKIAQDYIVETDRKWLGFMTNQILSNAIKYSAGSRTDITIAVWKTEQSIFFEIQDQGVGISKEDLPRVFRPFYTGGNGRKFKESTGMGLYLVKNITEKLHHEIEIESEVGIGTRIQIIFPYASPE
ncbi:HAMP domain-containing sensor histidine kinase [Bacillus sp. FDAARGOS_1420]|uniref:sensor histidine kinase n=1 Tax=unclassified Bacillus (in: firmicutes) TaxID=185979 RepID=UPI001C5A6C12|nr:sensor histidine kinase [Bacillus sp. FDAARGOS_1420]MBW3496600.1 sensor histidine kinase [Bacillus sp. FDAARGOS_1420]